MHATTTFLLVEDDRNDAMFVELEFKHAPGHLQLRVVGDGLEAIQYLEGRGVYADRQEYPLPNVILLDLKMPRVNGFEFLEWLRTKSPNNQRLIPVIVMSSSAVPEDVTRCYALGVNSYIVKPVDWLEFKKRIKTLGVYWSEHVEKPAIVS